MMRSPWSLCALLCLPIAVMAGEGEPVGEAYGGVIPEVHLPPSDGTPLSGAASSVDGPAVPAPVLAPETPSPGLAAPLFGRRYSGPLAPAPAPADADDDGGRGGLIVAGVESRSVRLIPEEGATGIELETSLVQRRFDVSVANLSASRNGVPVTAVDQEIDLLTSPLIHFSVRQRIRPQLHVLAGLSLLEGQGGDANSRDTDATGTGTARDYSVERAREVGVSAGLRWKQKVYQCLAAEADLALRQAWYSSRLAYVDPFGTRVELAVSDSGVGSAFELRASCRIDPFLSVAASLSATDAEGVQSGGVGLQLRWHLR